MKEIKQQQQQQKSDHVNVSICYHQSYNGTWMVYLSYLVWGLYINCSKALNFQWLQWILLKIQWFSHFSLISLDVVNMFPSIHNESGMKRVECLLNTRSNLNPPTLCILEALHLCLECDTSLFNNKFYLKIDEMV